MEQPVYFWAALVGTTLLVIQVILQIIGLGADTDADAGGSPDVHVDVHADVGDPAHGTAGNVFFGILSFKALVAFAAIFGLTGLSLLKTDFTAFHRISLSVLAGLVAMVVVAYLMRMLYSLGASGSVVISNALGCSGEVYLRIPAHGEGRGKVTLEVQGRTVELPAATDGEAIPTGRTVRVIEVLGGEAVKVEPV